jgi:hypothetical protein
MNVVGDVICNWNTWLQKSYLMHEEMRHICIFFCKVY